MQHFDVVVFDVDGTLLDTSEGVLASVKYTIKEHNLPEVDEEVLKTFIGPPIQNSFSKVYGLKGDILQELATRALFYFFLFSRSVIICLYCCLLSL